MKQLFTLAGIAALIATTAPFVSCKKGDPAVARPKEQLIAARWSINRVQVKGYLAGTLVKDSLVPNTPQPVNFVQFDGAGNVEYRFNKPTSDFGTYRFVGDDSIHATIGGVLYRWKNLLLTETNMNVVTSGAYPAIPGATMEVYQTFVR
jgi:hypothetical protein